MADGAGPHARDAEGRSVHVRTVRLVLGAWERAVAEVSCPQDVSWSFGLVRVHAHRPMHTRQLLYAHATTVAVCGVNAT